MRERHNNQSIAAWLDTPAGLVRLAMNHGDRRAAAAELAADEASDRAFRQAQAERLHEMYPTRYASVADARAQVADPLGSSGATFTGSADELSRLSRYADVTRPIRNMGEAPADGHDTVVLGPDGVADTRPPWQRG